MTIVYNLSIYMWELFRRNIQYQLSYEMLYLKLKESTKTLAFFGQF